MNASETDQSTRRAIAAELRRLIADLMPPAHAEDYDDRDEDVRETLRSVCLTLDARATELEGGASADCAATAGAQVAREQATDRATFTVAEQAAMEQAALAAVERSGWGESTAPAAVAVAVEGVIEYLRTNGGAR